MEQGKEGAVIVAEMIKGNNSADFDYIKEYNDFVAEQSKDINAGDIRSFAMGEYFAEITDKNVQKILIKSVRRIEKNTADVTDTRAIIEYYTRATEEFYRRYSRNVTIHNCTRKTMLSHIMDAERQLPVFNQREASIDREALRLCKEIMDLSSDEKLELAVILSECTKKASMSEALHKFAKAILAVATIDE